jgi:TolB-like protein/DNA-binding winged helix-turn-helix (wHTH) protein/Tfp pilus assembly protein PilF
VINFASFPEIAMATQPRVAGTLRFDGYELDVRAGELRKHGVRLRLRGQPLQVLEILLERAGEVVTREELQTRIWSGNAFGDFDHNLHNAVARIREVLGDSPENPRYIETLPRRGYRYVGPIQDFEKPRLASETGDHTAQPMALIAPPKRKRSLVLVVVCALLVLGLVALAMWLHARAGAAPIRSIAVLPLKNLSGDPSEEFFVDGMTDQLITDLAKIGPLRVISGTSVMQYKGAKKGLRDIARELNVDAIVEGSAIRSGQRVRITAQLIQARTDQHLWAETYDRNLGDILSLQSEVANAIAQQVRAQLTPTEQAQLHRGHAVNPAAYDDYLKGRLYFVNEFTKADALRKAQRYFEQSIQKDPDFALAYAGLADTYVYLAFAGALTRDQAERSAREALAKALKLDDSIGEAYDTLGLLSWRFDWDWQAADREFNRAIALAPSYSCAHEDRAEFLAMTGRRAEALAEIAKVEQIDYGFSSAMSETETYYELRDYPNLIEASKRWLLLEPKDWSQHYTLGIGYEGTGKLPEAIAEYQQAIAMSGGSESIVALAHAYAALGKKAQAQKILRDLERKSEGTSASPYTMATIYAGLGENDKAFEFLEKAYSEKSLDFTGSLRADELLDSLRPDPRFQDLLRRVGLN